MRNRASGIYRLSIRILPVVFTAGIVTALVGAYLENRSFINAGAAIFLFGGAIWGLTNGGYLAWLYVRGGRKLGADGFVEDFAANPLKSAIFILLAMFLIAVGIGLSFAAWKAAFPK
jgi:hypothetical protein